MRGNSQQTPPGMYGAVLFGIYVSNLSVGSSACIQCAHDSMARDLSLTNPWYLVQCCTVKNV